MKTEPYKDTKLDQNSWIREFDCALHSDEFHWHRDLNDREIEVLEGIDWQFQFDNELPFIINKSYKFKVPKMVYHRLVPGTTNLKIKIFEHDQTRD